MLYHEFEKGHLPQPGGARQQTALYRASMMQMGDLKASAESWYREELRANK